MNERPRKKRGRPPKVKTQENLDREQKLRNAKNQRILDRVMKKMINDVEKEEKRHKKEETKKRKNLNLAETKAFAKLSKITPSLLFDSPNVRSKNSNNASQKKRKVDTKQTPTSKQQQISYNAPPKRPRDQGGAAGTSRGVVRSNKNIEKNVKNLVKRYKTFHLRSIRDEIPSSIFTRLQNKLKRKSNGVYFRSVDHLLKKPKLLKEIGTILGYTKDAALTDGDKMVIVALMKGTPLNKALKLKPSRGRPSSRKAAGKMSKTPLAELSKMEHKSLVQEATEINLNTAFLKNVPHNDVHKDILPYLIFRHHRGKPVTNMEALRKHARDDLFLKLAPKVGYGKTKYADRLVGSERDIIAHMMITGITREDAIRNVGSRPTKKGWVFPSYNGKSVQVKRDLVDRMKERLPRLSDEQIAAKIAANKIHSRQHGKRDGAYFNFSKNKFMNSNGTQFEGEDFANIYHQIAKNKIRANTSNSNSNKSNSNNTNSNNTNSNRLHLFEQEFHPTIYDNVLSRLKITQTLRTAAELYGERMIVEKNLLQKAFAASVPAGNFNMNRAKKAITMALGIGGPLEGKPMFMGSVGKPIQKGGRVILSPLEQMQREDDGCSDSKKWPGGMGYSLSAHQGVVQGVCSLRAKGMITTPGFLAFHSVGAGKTVMSLGCIVAFWNDESKCILPAAARSNSKSNDLNKFAYESILYFPWFKSDLVGKRVVGGKTYDFLEFPFATGSEVALQQLRTRLRYGHAVKGHPGAHLLDDDHLLNTYTTTMNMINTKHAKSKGGLQNYVFICDEMQLLFNPPSSELGFREQYKQFENLLHTRNPKNTFAIGLTATPGENEADIVRMYACLLCDKKLKNMAQIPDGLVSSAYVSGDTNFFPRVKIVKNCAHLPQIHDGSNENENEVETTKNPYKLYTISYLTILSTYPDLHAVAGSLLQKLGKVARKPSSSKRIMNQTNANALRKSGVFRRRFLQRARQISEYITVSRSMASKINKVHGSALNNNEPDELNDENLFDTLKTHILDKRSNVVFARTQEWSSRASDTKNDKCILLSPKIIGLVNALTDPRNSGTHFVFGNDGNTLKLMAHILRTRHGWQMYKSNHGTTASTVPRFGFLNKPSITKTRFLDQNAVVNGNVTSRSFSQPDIIRSIDIKNLGKAIEDDRNRDGGVCKVIFASLDSYKGTNTKNLRHIHCVSALPMWTDLLQLVGRGTRFKGHCGVEKKNRDVKIHTWRLEPPQNLPVNHNEEIAFPDDFIYKTAFERYSKGFAKVLATLKQKSIDKEIYGHRFNALADLEKDLVTQCERGALVAVKDHRLVNFNTRKNEMNKFQRRHEQKLEKKLERQRMQNAAGDGPRQKSAKLPNIAKLNENALDAIIAERKINKNFIKNASKNHALILKRFLITKHARGKPVVGVDGIKPQALLEVAKVSGIVQNGATKLTSAEQEIVRHMIRGKTRENAIRHRDAQKKKPGRKKKSNSATG